MTKRRPVTVLSPDLPIGNKARHLRWLADHGVQVPRAWVVSSAGQVAAIELDRGLLYAVRSSSTTEDGDEFAHAGELLTELDVEAANVQESVVRVLLSGADAVIIQRMVQPEASGVSFSRNPVTGLSDVVIEAISGRGDALLARGRDPLRWVSRNGAFVEEPAEPAGLTAVVEQVVADTHRLAADFGPADLEWVWDGSEVWWVQIRPITAIDDVPLFSRRIAKDVLPGMIKPLVWSVNVPMVNRAWLRLFTEVIGPNHLQPEDLARAFAYRAYFDMRAIGDIFEMVGMPRDSLENLLGLPGAKGKMRPGVSALAKTPRMVGLAGRLATGKGRLERERSALHRSFESRASGKLETLTDSELTAEIDDLIRLGEAAAYLNIVVPLINGMVNRRLKKRLEAKGMEDLALPASATWDPAPRVVRLGDALRELGQERLAAATAGDLSALDDRSAELLAEVLEHHGYLSENNNDLSVPRWRDDPVSVVKFASASRPARRDHDVATLDIRTRRTVGRAARWAETREAVAATYAFGYGLLRPRFLEAGRRLTERGLIAQPEDAFYLTHGTVVGALVSGDEADLSPEAVRVRAEMEEVADLEMPEFIVGDEWVAESAEVSDRLVGVGVSRGRYRGTARYVGSFADADRLGEGEVLVVEYSDVAWTPLFSRSGAVVTAAGGILSHSAITARELGLPCVASVPSARRLDGRLVLVDGFAGTVFVED